MNSYLYGAEVLKYFGDNPVSKLLPRLHVLAAPKFHRLKGCSVKGALNTQ